MPAAKAAKGYAEYALNIPDKGFSVFFNLREAVDAHGDRKSGSESKGVFYRTQTMTTSAGTYRVVVYRGNGTRYPQDDFFVDLDTPDEVLRVMRQRATGFAAKPIVQDRIVEEEEED
jgi:hypothetical protein